MLIKFTRATKIQLAWYLNAVEKKNVPIRGILPRAEFSCKLWKTVLSTKLLWVSSIQPLKLVMIQFEHLQGLSHLCADGFCVWKNGNTSHKLDLNDSNGRSLIIFFGQISDSWMYTEFFLESHKLDYLSPQGQGCDLKLHILLAWQQIKHKQQTTHYKSQDISTTIIIT